MSSDGDSEAVSEAASDDYFLCVPATRFARAWSCAWADVESGKLSRRDMGRLLHVNCSYLSSGTAPTLEALKQHAKCLLYLISRIAAQATKGDDNGDMADDRPLFGPGDVSDWVLGPLLPYSNSSENHQVALWVIANNIDQADGFEGTSRRCALHEARNREPRAFENPRARPPWSHHELVDHANDCLELLDRHHADAGGLVALLPSERDEDRERLDEARQTLLGQWLLRTQDLVAHVRELELDHLGVLDLLGGDEAVVPVPVARQDVRFVMANAHASGDAFEVLHRALDEAEARLEERDRDMDGSGASGERKWMYTSAEEWHRRGMVPVDLVSRFYRLRGEGAKQTIFVVPAIEQYSAERRPSWASATAPTKQQAKRIAELEQQYKDSQELADRRKAAIEWLLGKKAHLQGVIAAQDAELRKAKNNVEVCEEDMEQGRRRCAALLEKTRAYEEKLEGLKRVLPAEYHEHLLLLDQ